MLGNHGSNLTEEELEAHTISAWKEGKSHLNRQINGSGRSYPRRLVHAGPYNSLKDVALKNLQNKVATVPIIHSSSQDGSFPQLLHLASLSGILKCICRHFTYSSGSLLILQQPIGSLPLGTWVPKIGESNGQQFAMLRPNPSLSSTLSLLVQGQEAPAETEPKFNPFTGSGRRLDGKPLNYQPPSVSSSSSGSKHKRPNVANGGGQCSSTGSTSQGTAHETQGKLVFGRNVNHTKDPQKEAAKEPKQEQPSKKEEPKFLPFTVSIGPEYCKVFVLKANKPNTVLETTSRCLRTVGEAVERYIVWRSIHVQPF